MSNDDTAANAPADDIKRKFKEALDKKNSQHRKGESHLDADSAVHSAHGPASQKREFRRKSGG